MQRQRCGLMDEHVELLIHTSNHAMQSALGFYSNNTFNRSCYDDDELITYTDWKKQSAGNPQKGPEQFSRANKQNSSENKNTDNPLTSEHSKDSPPENKNA